MVPATRALPLQVGWLRQRWHDAGTRRQAFYSKLPPGTYTFRVTASNNDGLWSEGGASFVFTIPPSFTQSVLLRPLRGRGLWAAVVALHNTAAAVHRTGQARLYERLAERRESPASCMTRCCRAFKGSYYTFRELATYFLSASGSHSNSGHSAGWSGAGDCRRTRRDPRPTIPGS